MCQWISVLFCYGRLTCIQYAFTYSNPRHTGFHRIIECECVEHGSRSLWLKSQLYHCPCPHLETNPAASILEDKCSGTVTCLLLVEFCSVALYVYGRLSK